MLNRFVYAITPFVLGLLLCACGNNPYRAVSEEGFRYQAAKISAQHFIVTVNGRAGENSAVEKHALVKAAQLCASLGYDWFEVIKLDTKNTDKQVRTHMEIWLDKGLRPDSQQAWSAEDLIKSTAE